MPRRIKPVKHTRFSLSQNESSKKRYPTKQAAERAAELRMVEHPDLDLTVYKALNGSWYLTRKKTDT